MAKYLVVHPVGKELTLEAVTPFAKAVKVNYNIVVIRVTGGGCTKSIIR